MLEGIDAREAGVVAVAGFGLGRHVEILARRFGDGGIVLVVEPDLPLLKALFSRIDFTGVFERGNVRIIDRADPAHVSRCLSGMDALLSLGIRLVEHPPSRARLDGIATEVSRTMQEIASNARMNVVTTLIRCASTLENQLANLPRFALGPGIDDLRGAAAGRPAIVVSAGPSLRRNIEVLADPAVRRRFVIIATQTTLKPLLAAGVSPHFVTALDYHEISRRFHEGIEPADIEHTELVIDPKVHPAVPEAWPGRIRCTPSTELDRVLGPLARGGGPFPAGATVAHLCHHLARHLGCDPVVFVGQDLGFTDGLYYAPGNAIHDVWAPEFGDFNTIETMEWERIVRHRNILSVREDLHGRRIFTDSQMLSYLRTFEATFLEEERMGMRVIDASEGGVRKAGTTIRTLASVIADEGMSSEGPIELPSASNPRREREAVVDRLRSLAGETDSVREVSEKARAILVGMVADQGDARKMQRHFKLLDRIRARVDDHAEARSLTDLVNQIGVFKRVRADRRLRLTDDLDPIERQSRELERDVCNVEWTGEAAELLGEMLGRTITDLDQGTRPAPGRTMADLERAAGFSKCSRERAGVVAVVPIDPDIGGIGTPRDLGGDDGLLQHTLSKLGTSEELDRIVVVVPPGFQAEDHFDRKGIGVPVEIRRLPGPVFPDAHRVTRAARVSSGHAWRGGIQGLTIYDEVLAPRAILEGIKGADADAAVVVGPDWPLVSVQGDHGVDAVVRRYRDRPELPYVFVQAPPGIGSILVTPRILELFVENPSRRAAFGHLLGYRSERPESDPVTEDCCIIPPAAVRDASGRFVPDTPRIRAGLADSLRRDRIASLPTTEAISSRTASTDPVDGGVPETIRVELGTQRSSPSKRIPIAGSVDRPPMSMETFRHLLDGLQGSCDVSMIFDGVGDPLHHPRFDEFAKAALEAGIRQVRIRTDLDAGEEAMDRLLAAPVEVIEIDLDAETAATWQVMHGHDGWARVIRNLERIVNERNGTGSDGEGDPSVKPILPWIVPRIERRIETIDEIPEFFERWRQRVGSAVIDGPTRWPIHLGIESDGLSPTAPPAHRDRAVALTRMSVLSDGSVPTLETDLRGSECIGRLGERPLRELWSDVISARLRFEQANGRPPAPWRS